MGFAAEAQENIYIYIYNKISKIKDIFITYINFFFLIITSQMTYLSIMDNTKNDKNFFLILLISLY